VEGEPTLSRIAQAMKAGRNFVTSGPLLLLEMGDRAVGDVVRVSGPTRLKVKVKAWASGAPGVHLTRVEVVRRGEVVKTFEIRDRRTEFGAEFEATEAETAWYLARGFGSSADQLAITNPIYFESGDYRAPQPTPAQVTAVVTDAATGRPLEGAGEVIQMVGLTPVKQSRHEFNNGRLTLQAPATARIEVRAPGYAPMIKSIFMDYPPLLDLTLKMRSEQLLDWRTFEEIKKLLAEVQLEFRLHKLPQ
jgi:hypothetical protein